MITLEKNDDYYKLTFSQRVGETSLPEPMRLRHIPTKFRQELWLSIETEINRSSYQFRYSHSFAFDTEPNVGTIIESYKYDILEHFHDEIAHHGPEEARTFFKVSIREGSYHEILTLIEYVLRHRDCSPDLRNKLIDVFDKVPFAYFVEEINGDLTIIPRVSRETGGATQQAIQTIQEGGMEGAATHLRDAAKHINNQQYSDSIADSIHAVESVARLISPKKASTLRPALDSLENAGVINHKVLKDAFSKLYGYTSNEQGIRHALLDNNSPEVGLDEAMFMFGACASFAAYLVNKHQQLKQQQDAAQ